jgi:SAM-dependent methyltransferase
MAFKARKEAPGSKIALASTELRRRSDIAYVITQPLGPVPEFEANVSGCNTITGRGIAEYENELGPLSGSLKGKKVLDIGSGEGNFLKECSELGADVVGVDPLYGIIFGKNLFGERQHRGELLKSMAEKVGYKHQKAMARLEKRPAPAVSAIAGVNEALPFKDDTFDYVLSCCSSFLYIKESYPFFNETEFAAKKMLEEIIRVLKPGGEAHITVLPQLEMDTMVDTILEEITGDSNSISWGYKPSHPHVLVIRKI